MRRLVVCAALLLAGCGGSDSVLGGCWNYELRDSADSVAASGLLHMANDATGDFTLTTALPISEPPASGLVFGSVEPHGDYVLQLYIPGSPSRLIFSVAGATTAAPLSGSATSHELSRTFAFKATRC